MGCEIQSVWIRNFQCCSITAEYSFVLFQIALQICIAIYDIVCAPFRRNMWFAEVNISYDAMFFQKMELHPLAQRPSAPLLYRNNWYELVIVSKLFLLLKIDQASLLQTTRAKAYFCSRIDRLRMWWIKERNIYLYSIWWRAFPSNSSRRINTRFISHFTNIFLLVIRSFLLVVDTAVTSHYATTLVLYICASYVDKSTLI